ncbi:MAG TPA: hypothetical protein VIH89_16355 [Candidatus Sulfotelmatobacter sp.]
MRTLKQRSEVGNQVVNKVIHTLERFNNRITLNNSRFSERYIKQEIYLLVHFRVGGINKEFVAYFQGEHPICRTDVEVRHGRHGQALGLHHFREFGAEVLPNVEVAERRSYRNQKTVLVDVVQLVESPERVVSSLVWFDCVDSVYSILPHSLYFSSSSGFIFRGIIKDRKVNVPGIANSPSANHEELISQVVESTSEIVENVPGDHGDFDWNGFGPEDVVNELSHLRITLGANFVGVSSVEGQNGRLQLSDVLVGPFDFKAD